MKTRIKKVIIILLIGLIGIQFIPTYSNQCDKALPSDINQVYTVPDNVKKILNISCYDCHSNNTNYPWYSKIQPMGFLLEYHIKKGKAALNFSEFGSYSKRRQANKLESITNQIKKDEMPLTSYTFIHTDAKLSEKEKIEIIEWIDKQIRQNLIQ